MTSIPQVGTLIKELRKKRGLTGGELGGRAGLSQSKISKIETGFYRELKREEIEHILNILEAPSTIRQQIMLTFEQRPDGRLAAYRYFDRNDMNARMLKILEMERKTQHVRSFMPNSMHALVQTVEYRRGVLASFWKQNEDAVLENIKLNTQRQDTLWEKHHKFHFILHETALYTAPAGRRAQCAQLDRLERLGQLPHLTVGIIPVANGLPILETGAFTILDEKCVNTVTAPVELSFTDPVDVVEYLKLFAELEQLAVYGDEALRCIHAASDFFSA